jgi:hypothetical protein
MIILKIDNNGDISFNSLGKLNFVSDKDLLAQSLNLRIRTEKGELIYNDDYGHPIFKGKINKENLLVFLNNTFIGFDKRVFKIEVISINNIDNSIYAEINIILDTNEIINLNLKI